MTLFRLESFAALILLVLALVIGAPRQWDGICIGLVLGVVIDRTLLAPIARTRGKR
ncbi:MAG TPA: hypothetical protein VKR24_07995 [Candidatus Limnocylindrales bacterium]|nr:hypothetical protein [Candidatus Limnocylindrales bacterium]